MTAARERLAEWVRQRRHHAAFRIAPADRNPELLERVRAALAAPPPPPPPSPPPSTSTSDAAEEPGPGAVPAAGAELTDAALADAATSLWRAELHAVDGGGQWQSKQTRHHLRAGRDALREAGLEIQEHDGLAFHRGLSVEVLAYQDEPDATAATVLETVRPSIYLHGRRIQMGQVVVARPVPTSEEHTPHA